MTSQKHTTKSIFLHNIRVQSPGMTKSPNVSITHIHTTTTAKNNDNKKNNITNNSNDCQHTKNKGIIYKLWRKDNTIVWYGKGFMQG